MKPIAIAAVILTVALTAAADEKKANELIQAAQAKETVQGDLKAAIGLYGQAVKEAGANRGLAAKALLRMAECHQKMGDAEARKIYQRVVNEYGDQKEAATLAQSRLRATAGGPDGSRLAWEYKWDVTAVSRDGRYLSYNDTAPNNGPEDLFIHDLVTGMDRKLTNGAKGEYADEAAFSPDGKQIAYIWYQGAGKSPDLQQGDLRILNLSGNGATPRIIKNPSGSFDTVVWSPDGKRLLTQAYPKDKGAEVKFVLILVQDGSSRVLDVNGGNPSFSPDSKYLAYDRAAKNQGQRAPFVFSIDAGREMPVALDGTNIRTWGWTKDGRLLFRSDSGGVTNLSAVAMTDGKVSGAPVLIKGDIGNAYPVGTTASGALYYQKSISGPPARLEIAPFDFAAGRILSAPTSIWEAAQRASVMEQYDWSLDGKYLAFPTPEAPLDRRGPAIVVRSIDTGATHIVPPLQGTQLANSQLRWSPDNRTLLAGGPGEVYLIDTRSDSISTFKGEALPSKGVIDTPRWSPDGKKILFRLSLSGRVAFFESDPDLKNPREIINRSLLGGVNLTPDGRTIISGSELNYTTLLSIPVAGGEPKIMYVRQGPLGNVFISPDGKYIAFVNATPATQKQTSAWIMPAAGGDMRQVFSVDPPFSVGMGMWAPDSKSFFMRTLGADGQQAAMWRVPMEGGQAVKVDTGLNLDQYTRFITPSPTGKWIAYVRGVPRAPQKEEVWVLDNLAPPAK